MKKNQNDMNRPIRVVLFFGPSLDWAKRRFICLLEENPAIEFLAAFCESSGQTFVGRVTALWKRRGFLALLILIKETMEGFGRLVANLRSEIELGRKITSVSSRIHFVPDAHATEVLETVKRLKPDLGLIYGGPIYKPELFEIPPLGTLGIHHGKLPEYRGVKITFWSIFNGEETAGVTIQRVNAGVDTGEIVKTGEVPLQNKSLRTASKELEELGLSLYIQAIVEVKKGLAVFRKQEAKKGKLYKDPTISEITTFYWYRLRKRIKRVFSGVAGSELAD